MTDQVHNEPFIDIDDMVWYEGEIGVDANEGIFQLVYLSQSVFDKIPARERWYWITFGEEYQWQVDTTQRDAPCPPLRKMKLVPDNDNEALQESLEQMKRGEGVVLRPKMTREEMIAKAKEIHDQRCNCDPRYLMSCVFMAQAILELPKR